jgi:predicted phage tail protein
MRDIYLHGVAGREFGRHFRLEVASPAEAVRALITLRPALRERLRQGWWRIVVGPPRLRYGIEPPLFGMHLGSQPLHLVPATPPAGGGDGKGIGGIIAGTVLIGAAIALGPLGVAGAAFGVSTLASVGLSYGTIALMGASMVFSGVAGLLTQPPAVQSGQQATDLAKPEDRPSFLFNGVTNNSQQGGPVPLVFGTHLVGSIVVSAGIEVEDIAA